MRRPAPKKKHEAVFDRSFLETNSIAPRTLETYLKTIAAMIDFFGAEPSPEMMEDTLLEYLDHMYAQGFGPEVGRTLLAALRALRSFSATDRLSRALKGWERLVPPASRWPIAWP